MNSHFDVGKWESMTLFEQMGNIGSEVGRAYSAKKTGDTNAMNGAFYRGLDLLDATAAAWVANGSRAREILRAREEFASTLLSHEHNNDLEQYFMQYAIAARINK